MGYYINPENETKEEFLGKYGVYLSDTPNKSVFEENPDKLPVCLVDNGPFTAAGICFDERELEAFTMPDDYRPKKWYLVDKMYLEPYM